MKKYNDILKTALNSSIQAEPKTIIKSPEINDIWKKLKEKYPNNESLNKGIFAAEMLSQKDTLVQFYEQVLDLVFGEIRLKIKPEDLATFSPLQQNMNEIKKTLNVLLNNKNIKEHEIHTLLIGFLMEYLSKKI